MINDTLVTNRWKKIHSDSIEKKKFYTVPRWTNKCYRTRLVAKFSFIRRRYKYSILSSMCGLCYKNLVLVSKATILCYFRFL
ncbi:unnamed protein product [Parnassius mnemosyne]|uniref:Ribosomal protein L32 n=1 Tax=Parnassius mnemosyne TaxID=213953 RepID=A0AAV1L161_9NEOP